MFSQQEFEASITSLNDELSASHEAREYVLTHCRKVIQFASKSIRCTHRRQFEAAGEHIKEASALLDSIRKSAKDKPEIYFAGFLQDAEKEVIEAQVILAIVTGTMFPTLQETGAGAVSYLHGLAEAASEGRRFVLDLVRAGQQAESEELLKIMEAIYEALITFDYPDGLTRGLRRSTDALRAVLERTRSDLTVTFAQDRLLRQLEKTQETLDKISQKED